MAVTIDLIWIEMNWIEWIKSSGGRLDRIDRFLIEEELRPHTPTHRHTHTLTHTDVHMGVKGHVNNNVQIEIGHTAASPPALPLFAFPLTKAPHFHFYISFTDNCYCISADSFNPIATWRPPLPLLEFHWNEFVCSSNWIWIELKSIRLPPGHLAAVPCTCRSELEFAIFVSI